MGMLHPRFNHLGRSKKKKSRPSKEQKAALLEHHCFLRSLGLNPERKRIKLRGAVPLDNAAHNHREPTLTPTSDSRQG